MKNTKNKNIAVNTAQQGDVLLKKLNALPEGLKPLKRTHNNEVVLALGETTGHYHGIADEGVELFENEKGEKFINVVDTVTLKHQEHKPITLTPGAWQVDIVNEHDYFADMQRKVID